MSASGGQLPVETVGEFSSLQPAKLTRTAKFGQKRPLNSPIHHQPIRMKTRKLLLGAFIFASLVAFGLWLRNEVRIDSCLDRGGRWDKTRRCAKALQSRTVARTPASGRCRPAATTAKFSICQPAMLARPAGFGHKPPVHLCTCAGNTMVRRGASPDADIVNHSASLTYPCT
jgi:hypothetical protein